VLGCGLSGRLGGGLGGELSWRLGGELGWRLGGVRGGKEGTARSTQGEVSGQRLRTARADTTGWLASRALRAISSRSVLTSRSLRTIARHSDAR
jgi:hypothetical protein